MRLRAAWIVVVTIVVASGCASVPEVGPERADGKVAADDQQARQILDGYDHVNNAANADRDADAIAAVETGPLLETSVTGYVLDEATGEEPVTPFFHTDVLAFSPRFAEYPMWFVASSRINGDPGNIAVQALRRDSVTDGWLVEQSALIGDSRLPSVELVDGAVPEATEQDVGAVRAVLGGVYEYLAGGDAPDGVDVSGGGLQSYRTWVGESTIQLDEVGDPDVTCATDDRAEMRVLPTRDGAVGVVTARCVITQSMLEEIDGEMTLSGELSALAPEAGRTAEFVSSHPLVVVISDDGTADVLSGGWRWADVTMSED